MDQIQFLSPYLRFIIAFAIAVVGNVLLVRPVVESMWEELGEKRPYAWHSRILGMIEGILYPTIMLTTGELFIVVWLGLKALGVAISVPRDAKTGARYNIFLIGSVLSLAFAVSGVVGSLAIRGGLFITILMIPIGLGILTFILLLHIRRRVEAAAVPPPTETKAP